MLGRVGVVCVTYNSAATVASTLTALPREELASVVVVDNASADDSVTVAGAVPHVRVLPQEHNLGYGRGNNAGVAATPPCELLLFCNPDARIGADDLQRLVRWLDAHPRCALVGPRLWNGTVPLPSSGDVATPRQLLRLVAPAFLHRWMPAWRHDPHRSASGPVGYVEGACFLVRRAALADAGGFDPDFFLFFEEMDLARRLAPQWTVDLCADASAQHLVAASRQSSELGARPLLVRSAAVFVDKHYGRARGRAFRAAARASVRARRRLGSLEGAAPAYLEALAG